MHPPLPSLIARALRIGRGGARQCSKRAACSIHSSLGSNGTSPTALADLPSERVTYPPHPPREARHDWGSLRGRNVAYTCSEKWVVTDSRGMALEVRAGLTHRSSVSLSGVRSSVVASSVVSLASSGARASLGSALPRQSQCLGTQS